MLSFILAAITLSGSIVTSVSHVQGHGGPLGGSVTGVRVTTAKTLAPPRAIPLQPASGTQTLVRCKGRLDGFVTQIQTTDPRGCAFASLYFVWF